MLPLLTAVLFILIPPLYPKTINAVVTVVDTHGRPIQNAEISVWAYEFDYETFESTVKQVPPTQKTDQAGNVTVSIVIDINEHHIFIIAQKSGFAAGWNGLYTTSYRPEIRIVLDRINATAGIVTDENNRPLTGVKVTAIPTDDVRVEGAASSLHWPDSFLTTTTDQEGRFSFDMLPGWATARFVVEYPGRAFTDTMYNIQGQHLPQYKAGTKDIHIVMHRGGQIKGKVTANRGINVGRIRVTARGEIIRTGKTFTTVSDRDGNFTLNDLPPDIYLVSIAADNSNPAQQLTVGALAEIEKPGQTVENIKIRLRKPIVMEVMVKNAETNQPISNASAWIYQKRTSQIVSHLSYEAKTDGRGIARILTLPGKCHIGANHKDYDIVYGEYLVRTTDKDFTISLNPHRILTGQVVYENGRPAANVEVAATASDTEYTLTDSNGRFQIQYSENMSQKRFCIARDTRQNLVGVVDITENDNKPVKIVLTQAAALTGRVIDPDNQPINMAQVRLSYSIPYYLPRIGNTFYTDENGRFQVNAIPYAQQDLTHRISVSARGYSIIKFEKINVSEDLGKTIELSPLILRPQNMTLDGMAVYEDGTPAAYKQVHLNNTQFFDTQPELHSVTDETGGFRFEGACDGWLRIQCGSVMQNDFGFVYAKGGDTVKILMDNNYESMQLHTPRETLHGIELPMLNSLTTGIDPNTTNGKKLLVCFWWIADDPGKTMLLKLKSMADELEQAGIKTILLNCRPYSKPYASINIGLDKEWLQKNKIPFPEADVPDMADILEVRRAAGVRFLPHMILTDENKIIIAEGFDTDWLNKNAL